MGITFAIAIAFTYSCSDIVIIIPVPNVWCFLHKRVEFYLLRFKFGLRKDESEINPNLEYTQLKNINQIDSRRNWFAGRPTAFRDPVYV